MCILCTKGKIRIAFHLNVLILWASKFGDRGIQKWFIKLRIKSYKILVLDLTLSHISMHLKVIHYSGEDIIVCLDLNSLLYNHSIVMHSCMPLDYQVKLMSMASMANYYAFRLTF